MRLQTLVFGWMFTLLPVTALSTTHSLQNVAVIGVGALGVPLCQELLLMEEEEEQPQVVGFTKTTARHSKLMQQLPKSDKLRLIATGDDGYGHETFSNVVFCAPPSGFQDYPKALREALKIWDRSGTFVFTSSGAV